MREGSERIPVPTGASSGPRAFSTGATLRLTTSAPVHGEFLFPQHFLGFASLLRWVMRELAVLFLHLLATVARLAGPGGVRAVVAESVLVKQ